MQNPDEMDFEEFKRHYQEVPVEEYPNNVLGAVPEPMVSVHVSTYQHADFIRDCLDGVLMQETDFPVEIIIGEDESDDGTREICKEYADRHPNKIRLFLHRRENNIQIHGRPTGRFQFIYSHFMARGKYLATCEGDDYWTDPKKLQKQVDFLEENDGCALTYHPWVVKVEGDSPCDTDQLLQNSRKEGKVRGYPRLLTYVLKNNIDSFPKQLMEVICGDEFLLAMVKEVGDTKFVSNVRPGVYRMYEESLYSSSSPIDQRLFSFKSRLKMLEVFSNTEQESRIRNEAVGWFHSLIRSPTGEKTKTEKIKEIFSCIRLLYRKKMILESIKHIIKKEASLVVPKYVKKVLS